jgi:hypothetical protein
VPPSEVVPMMLPCCRRLHLSGNCFQHVRSQAKAGMKKRLIVLLRSVETLNQAHNAARSKSASFALTSVHVGCDFDLGLAIHAHDSTCGLNAGKSDC